MPPYNHPSVDTDSLSAPIETPTQEIELVAPTEITQVAQQASDLGIKEVLDVSAQAALIGTGRPIYKVGEYLKDLLKSIDRIGSILGLFYWKNEAFEEHYGSASLQELEDKLINVFNELGDLTLFLKEKTVDADSLFDADKGNISEDMGEA
jgi:hypothetical protein